MARDLRDKNELPTGRKVGGTAQFFLGAADMPIDPPPGWQPDRLAAKIAAGAEFAQTQFCMDAGIVRRYAGRLAETPATSGVFLLIGIAPLRSAKSARWMRAAPLRHHHPRRVHRAAGAGCRSRRRGRAHLRRADRGTGGYCRGGRRPHHGAGERSRSARRHHAGAACACRSRRRNERGGGRGAEAVHPSAASSCSALSSPARILSAMRPAFCRIAVSILAAMSGLPLRKSLAFSRPWPMR